MNEFLPLFDENSDHSYILDNLKQLGFYIDCLGNGHWSIPEKIIDEFIATMLVKIAKTLCRGEEITIDEIELWIKHLGPVRTKAMNEKKIAIINWYSEMQKLGLKPLGSNQMEDFIYNGIEGSR